MSLVNVNTKLIKTRIFFRFISYCSSVFNRHSPELVDPSSTFSKIDFLKIAVFAPSYFFFGNSLAYSKALQWMVCEWSVYEK